MRNLKRTKVICFIKLITSVIQKNSFCVEDERKNTSPLIQVFLERRFCFSFVIMERIERLGGKCHTSQKLVKEF